MYDFAFSLNSLINCTYKNIFNLIQTKTSEFYIWYVNAADPWNRTMYDVVVDQMKENSLAKDAIRK